MQIFDKPVVDQTALPAGSTTTLRSRPKIGSSTAMRQSSQASTVSEAPNLFDAIQQQLGLKLTAQKTAVDVIVIDHVEKPSPN